MSKSLKFKHSSFFPNIATPFELVNKFTTEESEYYGPFNTLLYTLFPPTENYQVSPQFKRLAGSIDFTVIYIISRRKVPIMFLELKTYVAHDSDYMRKGADNQMRERYLEFTGGSIPLPKLYGISALGTRICVYEYKVASRTLTPPLITPPNPEVVTDVAPKERWNFDIMEPDGEARLKEVVSDIKAMVANLK